MKRSDPRHEAILVTVLWPIALLSALAMAASVAFRRTRGCDGVIATLPPGAGASVTVQPAGAVAGRTVEDSLLRTTLSLRAFWRRGVP